jgi:hypothetical protein
MEMAMKVKPQSPGSRGTATASTRRMGNIPSGGIGSKVVRREGTRDGSPGIGVSPGWASQLGSNIGNHVTEQGGNLPYRGEAMKLPRGPAGSQQPLGNELAKNIGKGGVGTGRTLYGQSGSQRTYGAPAPGNPQPKGELFPGWPAKR